MLKAALTAKPNSLLVAGLARENCERLLSGNPILVSLRDFIAGLPEDVQKAYEKEGLDLNLLICGGESAEAIRLDLAAMTSEAGGEVHG